MAFGQLRTWDIPRLTTYADAAAHEAKVIPIRGDANNTKPLGDRRRKYFNIRKDEATQDITVRMHRTDLVRYKPNGDVIINNGGWVSSSTHDMLGALLGLSVWTFDNRAWLKCYYQPASDIEPHYGEYPLPNNTDVLLRCEGGGWLATDLPVNYKYSVNVPEANKVRKRYAAFTKYLNGMLKVRSENITYKGWNGQEVSETVLRVSQVELDVVGATYTHGYANLCRAWEPRAEQIRELIAADDTESHYKAMMLLIRESYGTRYLRAGADIVAYPKDVRTFYKDTVSFIHKDEVLKRTAMVGKATKDPYARWFR